MSGYNVVSFLLSILVSLAAGANPQIMIETGSHEPTVALKNNRPVIGLASAGSTFVDHSETSSKVATVGSASIVRIGSKGKLAILTAAYVVGGQDPWVEVAGKKLKAKSFLIDNDNDVAILELTDRRASEALVFDQHKLKIAPAFMKGIDDEQIPMAMIAYYHPGHALGFALRPWVDAGVESAYTRSIQRVPIISQTEDGRMIRVLTKITSGASGSAVLDLKEKSVAGLVVESHYYFSETYLVSPTVLVQHFELFAKGRRGSTSKTAWQMKNHLEYRVFSDGTEEANFITRPTSGVLGQPGNGVLGQPGNGVLGQPGNGILGQPGNGIIGQPGNGVIGQPTKEKSFQPWSENPRSVFDFFHLEPGLKWNDQPVIGFDVQSKTPVEGWPTRFELLAEPSGAHFLELNKDKFDVAPLTSQTNFIQILRRRLSFQDMSLENAAPGNAAQKNTPPATDPSTIMNVDSKKAVSLTPVYGPSAVTNYNERSEPDHISVTLNDESVHVKVKVYSRMNRQTWKLEEDEIEFTLGKNGAPLGEARFLPVIETKGLKSGELFYVDLRQFFFTDYSQLAKPIEGWTPENAPFDLSRFDLKNQISTIGFAVRNAASGAEFTYGFKK